MMGMMKRGGAERLKMSQMNMMGAGTGTMKSLMKKVQDAVSCRVIWLWPRSRGCDFVACTTSMALMGLEESDFIDEVDEFAGAATYLGLASEAKVNLFI